jgi:hypothetical protein
VYGIGAILVGLFGGVLIAETAVRQGKLKPPRQVIRGFGMHSVDGVPVWERTGDRHNRECVEQHPQRTRILFFGSSITFGSSLNPPEVFTAALEQRLNEARPDPGFCVLNFAQEGYAFDQKYAIASMEVPRYRPALIMWEDWVEWSEYRMIGDTAYAIGDLAVRPDGFVGIEGMPDALNRVLFLHSRLYEYIVLVYGERVHETPGGPNGIQLFADTRLSKVPPLAQSVGAKLVFYLAPPLDQPFAETAASLPDWHAILLDFAQKRGIPVYPLQRELIDQDYLALRLDPCCHYNAAGHRALVPIMERILLEQLDGVGSNGGKGGSARRPD